MWLSSPFQVLLSQKAWSLDLVVVVVVIVVVIVIVVHGKSASIQLPPVGHVRYIRA